MISNSTKPSTTPAFKAVMSIDNHSLYFHKCLEILPHHYTTEDNNRVVLALFSIGGLDILNKLDIMTREVQVRITEWILSLQRVKGGFAGNPTNPTSHITATFASLSILAILQNDMSNVNKAGIMRQLRELQLQNGAFLPTADAEEEYDLRFMFSACAVCYFINDWSAIDKVSAKKFILDCQSYDKGFGQRPYCESHGGSTFCALASLSLMGELTPDVKDSAREWLLMRCCGGFQGRRNKDPDTCYSFWVGASLKLIGSYDLVDHQSERQFLDSTQCIRGFSKNPESHPDLLHSFFGVAAFSLLGSPGISSICPDTILTERAVKSLKQCSIFWK